jgi:DNA segregation ATPase FtsK/SpoIIIE-like protein
VTELDRRKTTGQGTPSLFVVVDEVRELLDVGGDPVAESIRRIATLGRELGVHIIVATQHALIDALGGSIAKANLVMRLTGRVADASAAYVATGMKGSGAETLQGNGDFLLTAAGESHRVQIAYVRGREFGRLPRVENTPRIDFGDYDPERVLDVAPRPKADPLDPEQLAIALASDRGIRWLKVNLGIGQDRATYVRRFAQAVVAKLNEMGVGVYPIPST